MAVDQISSMMTGQNVSRTTGTAASGDEKNMFMTLLVAQLKNQDPLQPQDGTAFVAQLAQFNSLDQLMAIRQSIDALNTKMTPVTKRTADPE
jgi:flagellar basal-body rod modification protein FlgD